MSRLLGGHFHNLGTLQRAYANIPIYQSKSTPTLESHSFLERVLRHVRDTWPASNAVLSGIVADVKEENSIISLYISYHEVW